MRKIVVLLVALAALVAAGCGSSSSGGSGLPEALSFMPKTSPFLVSIDTDPNGDQIKGAMKLLDRFGPVSTQFKQGFEQALKSRGIDLNSDVKPVLGNRLVAAAPNAQSVHGGGPGVVALKVKDEGKAKAALAKFATKVGTVSGADVYHGRTGGNFSAISDGVLVSAGTEPQVQQAIERHNGGDSSHMTESDYDRLTSGVNKDALVVVGVDIHNFLTSSPKAAKARQVKWVNALQTGAIDFDTGGNGIGIDLAAKTTGLTPADLPLAAGAQSPKLVRRAAEVGFGIRGLSQSWAFGKSVAQIVDPKGYAKFVSDEQRANKQLGLDIEKDIVQQLSGDLVASVGIDGGYAVRAQPKNAAAFKTSVDKLAARATKLKGSDTKSVKRGPAGLYVLTDKKGKKTYLGMIGHNFVVAKDPARAQQIAAQSTSSVPGAKGALTIALDARSLANAVADKQRQPQAKLFTGSLGDFIGSVESETSGLTGHFRLNFR